MAAPALPQRRLRPAVAGAVLRLAPLPCALLVALVAATMVGSVAIPPGETIHILLYKLGLHSGAITWPAQDEAIIWSVRVPRVLAAGLVGASLAVAGTLFQAVLRNPLADPYVIGSAAGAQLGVAIALLVPLRFVALGFGPLQAFAFAGALGSVLFVYSMARAAGRTPVVTLLLAGFVLSSFLISASSLLMMLSNRANQIMTWTMGSMDVSELSQLWLAAPLIGAASLGAYALSGKLDVLLLGEEQAAHLGVRVEWLKLVAVVLASLLTALAVTLAGIVAFVGLVVPHAARLVYGPGHRLLVPNAACGGAVFVILADLLARAVLAPVVLPLGAVTAVVGAPFFLHLLRRSRREYAV